MAEVNTGGGHDKGKGKKVKQKKVNLRVDFTPMVDMNMLLITFFMFCTSLSKPQTMEINMPSRDKIEEGEESKVRASEAVTIILGGDDKVFYYFGLVEDKSVYDDPNFLIESNYSETGLRAMLLSRNKKVIAEMQELKAKKLDNQISEEDFRKQSIEIKGQKGAPTVMIKAMNEAVYKKLIDVLDEMQICNVGKYAVVDIQEGDEFLVYKYLGLITQEDYAKAPSPKK